MMKYNEAAARRPACCSRSTACTRRSKGARVTFAGGKPTVTDGPFTEAKELIGGYWMIDVKSKEEAIEWAKRCPLDDGDFDRGPPGARDDGLPRRRPGGRRRAVARQPPEQTTAR